MATRRWPYLVAIPALSSPTTVLVSCLLFRFSLYIVILPLCSTCAGICLCWIVIVFTASLCVCVCTLNLRLTNALSACLRSLNSVLPAAWSSLTSLSVMDLSKNQLSSTLPVQWQYLTSLLRLDLSNNTFVSTIPSAWQSGTPYMSQLTRLLLSGNSAM